MDAAGPDEGSARREDATDTSRRGHGGGWHPFSDGGPAVRPLPALTVIGSLTLLAGIVGAPLGWDAGGVTPLLLLGFLALAFVVLQPRITSIRIGEGSVEVSLQQFSRDVGDVVADELYRLQLGDLLLTYLTLHGPLRSQIEHAERVKLQDALVRAAGDRAAHRVPDVDAMRQALVSPSKASRMIALGVARVHQQLATIDTLATNIGASLTANEQFHALKLAREIAPRLSAREARRLRDIVVHDPYIEMADVEADEHAVPPAAGRRHEARELLAALDRRIERG